MSDMREAQQSTQMPTQRRTTERVVRQQESTGWFGWILFGSMMMIMVGAFQAIVGLTALFQDDYFLVTTGGLVVDVDYTAWGWVHLGLGALAVAAGVGLLSGRTWARVVAIALCMLSAIVNLAFIPAYPVWSIIVIALDVIVIYALAAHGKEYAAAA
jgi:hypothetical protein